MRATLDQWERSPGQDTGALLRGTRLPVAEEWLARRPQGVTASERRYIEASRHHQRRGTRLRRAVAALIAALLVAASAGVGVAYNQSQQRAEEQRRRAAIPLAQESRAGTDVDAVSAVQFAQAAWRYDPPATSRIQFCLENYAELVMTLGVDSRRERTRLPIPSSAEPVELTADGKLITKDEDGLAIWSLEAGARVTSIYQPSTAWLGAGRTGTDPVRLVGLTEFGMLTLDMDPNRWFEHLCQLNRDYTDEERGRRPRTVDPAPPCETG